MFQDKDQPSKQRKTQNVRQTTMPECDSLVSLTRTSTKKGVEQNSICYKWDQQSLPAWTTASDHARTQRPPSFQSLCWHDQQTQNPFFTCTANIVFLKAHVSAPATAGMPFPSLCTIAKEIFFTTTRGIRNSRLCPVENTDRYSGTLRIKLFGHPSCPSSVLKKIGGNRG